MNFEKIFCLRFCRECIVACANRDLGKTIYVSVLFVVLVISACLSLLTSLPAMALSSDREQPINIESDRLDIDEEKGISTYQGNVHYTQGTIILDADILVVHSREGEVYKLEAFGDPAHYRQELDNDKGDLSAKAKSMEYVADNGKLVLRENVRIVKGEDVFTGNIIEYSTRDEIVSARKAESGEERVQVIIQPRQQTPQPNAQ